MKILVLSYLSLLITVTAFAQKSITMCGTTAQNTEAFARLADDATFRRVHPNPHDYAHTDAAGEMLTFATPDGREGSAYAIRADESSEHYLLVIHEWWGLNDHIKQKADQLYQDLDGVNVLALDLYDGQVATDRERAREIMQSVSVERAQAIIEGAIAYAGEGAGIATIGWCFGGGWSLQATILADEQAAGCVMYYGMPVQEPEQIAAIEADVLGIFGAQDNGITPEVVRTFEEQMEAANKEITVEMYEAGHGFANPSNPNYAPEATKDAYEKTLAFLREHLDGG